MRPLRHAGQPSSGINVLSLWASAMAHGFAAPIWMTYRQAGELGGQVLGQALKAASATLSLGTSMSPDL